MKIKRNSPCLCGSGLKFKHCCLPGAYRQAQIEREIMNEKPSNQFRDELEKKAKAERDPVEVETEKVGEAEMMRRDTYATMRSLQVQRDLLAMDRAYAMSVAVIVQTIVKELQDLPISSTTEDTINNLCNQGEGICAMGEKAELTRNNVIVLEALEAKVAFGNAAGPTLSPVADDQEVEESLGETAETAGPEDDSLDDEPGDDAGVI